MTLTAPDPFQPAPARAFPFRTAHRAQLSRQLPIRSRILAETRRLLAEASGDRVTLSSIAAAAEVSIQTMRNHFGRRDELIIAAVNDHTTAIWTAIQDTNPGALAFMDFPHLIQDIATRFSGFLSASIETAFSRCPALAQLQQHASANKLSLFRTLQVAGHLRDGIDPRALARQMTRVDSVIMFEWSRHGDSTTLGDEMLAAHRLLMIGALRPNYASTIGLGRMSLI